MSGAGRVTAAGAAPVEHDEAGAESTVARVAHRLGWQLARLQAFLERLPTSRPSVALSLLVAADWLMTADVARIAAHHGWRYPDAGLGTPYYTSAWVIGHGHLPATGIGYGAAFALAPLTWFTGTSLVAALPPLLVLNVAILSPLALVALYSLARELAGRRYAYAVALAWISLPLLGIRYFLPDFHSTYVDLTLPVGLGLTASPTYPAMCAGLLATLFAYRSCLRGRRLDAVCAGLAAGLSIAVIPKGALLLLPIAAALLLSRRPRLLLPAAAGVAPSLAALALWQYRTVGHIPAFSAWPWDQTDVVWKQFQATLDGFREYGWSQRLLFWLVLAGLIGLARRTWVGALLIGGWFAAYLLVIGGDPTTSVEAGTFLTRMLPTLPAFVLLVVSTVFLVPILGRRPPRPAASGRPRPTERAQRGLAAVLALLALLPLPILAALPRLTRPAAVEILEDGSYVPAGRFPLTARLSAAGLRLSWPRQHAGSGAELLLFRSPALGPLCVPVAHAASRCELAGQPLATLPLGTTAFLVRKAPLRGTYAIALAALPAGPETQPDPLLLSDEVSTAG